jgi:hypothetical protein
LRLNVLKILIINFNFITFSQWLNFSAGLAGKFCQEMAALVERPQGEQNPAVLFL